ncbi:hypothetical protein [Cellulomonas sp. ATA003]|uniref:hypothetical protein n=1 Tax=Cellulomonas sp. ATA003 TaxID=3073064 RepID=UPI002873E32C|nr:hypothetical protein [Cellulomonas sp. ATA003]WNB84283.1 hypothetical protein REH70_10275 [Cellulomonas sp. ATA003]
MSELVAPARSGAFVRLAYHYTDGRDVVTDAMTWSEALAYLPLLCAVPLGDRHYAAPSATIDLVDA